MVDMPECLIIRNRDFRIYEQLVDYTAPISFDFSNKLSNSFFVTLTFDPNKFGVQPFEHERKQYLKYQFSELLKLELIQSVYGSIEYHANGIPHCHAVIIMPPSNQKIVYRILKEAMTDNKRNRVSVQLDSAKWPNAIKYIEKESEEYFIDRRFIPDTNFHII